MAVVSLFFSEMLLVCCGALSAPLCREWCLSRESLSLVVVKFTVDGEFWPPSSSTIFCFPEDDSFSCINYGIHICKNISVRALICGLPPFLASQIISCAVEKQEMDRAVLLCILVSVASAYFLSEGKDWNAVTVWKKYHSAAACQRVAEMICQVSHRNFDRAVAKTQVVF